MLGTEGSSDEDIVAGDKNEAVRFTDCDVFAGRIAKGEYDTDSTTAEAVAVVVD